MLIFYSLGNFIFDTDYQRVHLYTDVGVLLKLLFTEEAIDFEAIGIRIIRGDERIDIAPLPAIFTDIPAAEYELLAPLSAKAFVAEDRRKNDLSGAGALYRCLRRCLERIFLQHRT